MTHSCLCQVALLSCKRLQALAGMRLYSSSPDVLAAELVDLLLTKGEHSTIGRWPHFSDVSPWEDDRAQKCLCTTHSNDGDTGLLSVHGKGFQTSCTYMQLLGSINSPHMHGCSCAAINIKRREFEEEIKFSWGCFCILIAFFITHLIEQESKIASCTHRLTLYFRPGVGRKHRLEHVRTIANNLQLRSKMVFDRLKTMWFTQLTQ